MVINKKNRIRFIVLFTFLIVFFFSLTGCKKEMSIDDLFYSVFELKCSSEGKFDSFGTAFLLVNGDIITNAHVVSYKEYGVNLNHEEIIITLFGTNEKIRMQVKEINNKLDYAILEPIEKKETINKIRGLNIGNSSKISVGDDLFTLGNLNNYGLSYNDGILSSKLKNIEYNGEINSYYQTNIEISKGSSGGPVLNTKCEVVGVMTFKVRDGNMEYVDGMSFFIPIERIIN